MSKGIEQENYDDITELAEGLSLDDELELEIAILAWLQEPPVQLQEYGFAEVDREDEYFATLNEISDYYLTER